ncbi:MAG TPA: hypothetical protein PLF42_01755 [Anaerolineales bacterium]|nr:hypothetical protein [Anaerolineales bacterium]
MTNQKYAYASAKKTKIPTMEYPRMVASPENINRIATILRIAFPIQRAETMAWRAVEYAQDYAWEKIARQIVGVYEELAGTQRVR